MDTELVLLFFVYIFCIVGLLIISEAHIIHMFDWPMIKGGAFDFQDFLNKLKKKYGKNSKTKSTNVEVEIKIKCNQAQVNKIVEWIEQQKYIETKTTNRIWNNPNIIETINMATTASSWHKKDRLSKYDFNLKECAGKITVAIEQDLMTTPSVQGEPNLIRNKHRKSVKLNNNWRIDCTWIDNNDIPEIEAEYIGPDYWNALKKIERINKFIDETCA